MQFFIAPNLIVLIIAIGINLALVFIVYKHNTKSATNIIFALLGFVTSAWLIANFISIHPQFSLSSLFWIRSTIFLATPLTLLFFLFAYVLPHEQLQLPQRYLVSILVGTVFVMLTTISPYAFTGVRFVNNSPHPSTGPGMLPFAIFSTLMTGFAISFLIRKFINSQGVKRQQILFVCLGIFLMTGALITTVFIPAVLFGMNKFVPYIPLYTLLFLGMTAYAIVKHSLFNIRVIATELFSVLIALIFFVRVLSSNTFNEFIFNLALFIILSIFGVLLIRGTLREIRELERLSRAKSEFVSIASHQLRAPLTAIKGFMSMIEEGSGTEENRKDWLKKIGISNERLVRLVDDLLNISRIERGTLQYNFEDVDFVQLIDNVIADFQFQAKTKNLSLAWKKPSEDLPKLRVDSDKMIQVITNLVDNALKYTEKGSVVVRLLYLPDLGRIRLIVQDTGIGIPKEDLQNLFELFSRGAGAQKTSSEGVGVGLYVARKVVEAHQGKIWVESEGLHKGSRFYVELPTS